jgi:hypothetical protein
MVPWISIEISPILEWAYLILQFAVTWVWIFCLLVAIWILYHGAINRAHWLVKGRAEDSTKVSRLKE